MRLWQRARWHKKEMADDECKCVCLILSFYSGYYSMWAAVDYSKLTDLDQHKSYLATKVKRPHWIVKAWSAISGRYTQAQGPGNGDGEGTLPVPMFIILSRARLARNRPCGSPTSRGRGPFLGIVFLPRGRYLRLFVVRMSRDDVTNRIIYPQSLHTYRYTADTYVHKVRYIIYFTVLHEASDIVLINQHGVPDRRPRGGD